MFFKPRKKAFIIGYILIVCIFTIGLVLISQIRIPGLYVAYDVYIDENYAYLTNNDGCIIIDLENYRKTCTIGVGTGFGVFSQSDLVFVGSSNTFFIYNISIPENPAKLSEWNGANTIYNFFIEGSYAYIANYEGGFDVVDISNPQTPINVCTFNDIGRGLSIRRYQNLIFYADPDNGLKVINITDFSSPSIIRTIAGTQGAWDIHIHQNYLLLGCHGNGVKIMDISEPQLPIKLGQYLKPGGEAYGVTGNETHLYVADLQKGVYLLNITDPSNPTEVTQYRDAAPHGIFSDGKKIYLADQDRQLIILETDLTYIYSSGKALASFEFPVLITTFILILFCKISKIKERN